MSRGERSRRWFGWRRSSSANGWRNLLLHGNAYVQAIGDGERVVELGLLRPERVSVVADERGCGRRGMALLRG